MGFGGPVWHLSVASQRLTLPESELRALAHAGLDGAGDASLGEWEERGESALHLRRRLSAREALSVGPVSDVRGTVEQARRVASVLRFIPPAFRTPEMMNS